MGIADRLAYARSRAAVTLAQVEERTGIGKSSLSEFENGKREPSLSQLQSLAAAYRRSVAFFLAHSFQRDFGHGRQRFLPRRMWSRSGAGQLELLAH